MKKLQIEDPRIVHIAPYYEEGNPFGGPLSVAINLVSELNIQACTSILLAGTRSQERFIEGIPSKLFKSLRIYRNKKITGLFSPNLIFWIIRNRNKIDILHIHLAREMNTTVAALIARFFEIPYVLQTHGMIRKSKNTLEKIFDIFLTKNVIRNSLAVLYLTEGERIRLEQVESKANFKIFPNSVRVENSSIDFQAKNSEVIFISRLHRSKQPLVFLDIALEIASKYPQTRFTVIGPDGGELSKIISLLSTSNLKNVCYEGILNPSEVQTRLSRSQIFVLPTLEDVYPLAILEAMASGCAIVTTNACEISTMIESNKFGIVTYPTKANIQSAIESLLLDLSKCQIMGYLALEFAITNLNAALITKKLKSEVYLLGRTRM